MGNSAKVYSPAGESVSLMIPQKTTSEHNDITTKAGRPAVGDRVVAEAEKEAGHPVAQEVRVATPKSK